MSIGRHLFSAKNFTKQLGGKNKLLSYTDTLLDVSFSFYVCISSVDEDGTTTLSKLVIVVVAGGVGLLVLILVLGLLGLFAFSRWRRTVPAAAAAPRPVVAQPPRQVYQIPQRPRQVSNEQYSTLDHI